MINLPTTPREFSKRKNPKRLIIYSKPKVGKTTMISKLENTLIIDLENGSDHLGGLMVVKVIGLAPGKESPEGLKTRHAEGRYYLSEVIKQIQHQIKTKGYPYQKVAIDTVSKLEDWCEEFATVKYMKSSQGKGFNRVANKVIPKAQWESVLTLPNGAGYMWLRLAFNEWIGLIDTLAPDIILIAHLKEKSINKEGKEISANELNLTGKIGPSLAANSDAIGYAYRKRNKTYINFKGGDDNCGSRCAHLKGQEIVILEEDDAGNILSHWDQIYIDSTEE